jgi:transposase-like protein
VALLSILPEFPGCRRDVEEILLERGVIVTYEAIRKWCRKFGQRYANQLRRRCPRLGDKWYMDEVFLTFKGEHHYLWRAVDQDGNVLDILVQRRRDKHAAKKFFRKLLKCLTGYALETSAQRQVLALDLLHRQLSYRVLLGRKMPLIYTCLVCVIVLDAHGG